MDNKNVKETITSLNNHILDKVEKIENEYIKDMTKIAKQLKETMDKYREKGIDPVLAQTKLMEVIKKELLSQ